MTAGIQGGVVLSVGDCVQQQWECLESTGTIVSVQPSFAFGESVQCCEVEFEGQRRWILSLNLVRASNRISQREPQKAQMG
jgi:hypothetical protein